MPGMFGRNKPLINQWGIPSAFDAGQEQGFGGGITGAADQPYQIDPQMPEMAQAQMPKPGFFGKGGAWKDTLGYGLGALAQQLGGSNPYEQRADREHEMAMLRMRSGGQQNDDTPSMREAVAMGLQPGSAAFNRYVREARMKPTFMMMGNPETGQQIVNPAEMGGGPPQEAIAELMADPSAAAEFDQYYGAGAAARYLGQ
jgi:hypothetical protein